MTPWCSLWRHCNGNDISILLLYRHSFACAHSTIFPFWSSSRTVEAALSLVPGTSFLGSPWPMGPSSGLTAASFVGDILRPPFPSRHVGWIAIVSQNQIVVPCQQVCIPSKLTRGCCVSTTKHNVAQCRTTWRQRGYIVAASIHSVTQRN